MTALRCTTWALFLASIFAAAVAGQTRSNPYGEFITSRSPLPNGTFVERTTTPGEASPSASVQTGVLKPAVQVAPPLGPSPSPAAPAPVVSSPAPSAPLTPIAPSVSPAARWEPSPPGAIAGIGAGTRTAMLPSILAGQSAWTVPTLGWPRTRIQSPPAAAIVSGGLASGTVYRYPSPLDLLADQRPTLLNPGGTMTGSWLPAPQLQLRNAPPGIYVHPGAWGRPKAFIDGQPLRNLLRYAFP